MKSKILIVDDQQKVCRSLALNLKGLGYDCDTALCSSEACAKIKTSQFDVVLLDLALGGESGLDLLREIKILDPLLTVIMMTGYGTLEDAVKAIKLGALDFIAKPVSTDHLERLVQQGISLKRERPVKVEGTHPQERSVEEEPFSIITKDEHFLTLLKKARKLALSHLPILILGESGTGKELLAHYIHQCSQRQDQSLTQVNCASFTDTLLESELFGHEKGSFTGAEQQHCGVFETADGGTLHLDEIADMALGTQAKVLRALQEGEIKRVGATQNLKVDLRVIASTHGDLKEKMESGSFRPDLYYRLSAAILTIPPLKSRKTDIPLLVEHFISKKGTTHSLDPLALKQLCAYPWPGNVRELKNAIEFSLAVCADDVITSQDLPEEIVAGFLETEGDSSNLVSSSLAQSEKDTIEKIYRECGFNKKKTAEQLGITRATLYKRLDKYELG